MKRFGTAIIFSLALVLVSCGGGSTPDVLSGNWTASLLNSDGTTAFAFNTTLTQSGSQVAVTKFDFANPSSCFAKGTTATAYFTLIGTTHGVTSGTFQMTFQSGPSNPNGDNSLAFQGTLLRAGISGSWSLTGTGIECTQVGTSTKGNFVMTKM